MSVSGGGVFNNTTVTKSSGTVLELAQSEPPPAPPESIYKDSFFTSASTALAVPADFTFVVTPTTGGAQTYSVRSNAVTSHYVTVTSPTGHTLAHANLGSPLNVHWQMSSLDFPVATVSVSGNGRTVPASTSGAQCHIVGQDLPPGTTSTTVTLPALCEGQPVLEAWFDVLVTGVNGERTNYTYGFRN